MTIDEMSNEDLARQGYSEFGLQQELSPVESLITRLGTTGEDLSYWFERSKIVRGLLHSGSRSPLL